VTRRTVRVDPSFFDELDLQLGDERGPLGQPSAGDFLLVELPLIAEVFATRFETLMQPIPKRPDYRSHLTSGVLVPSVLVTGQLGPDEVVTLLNIDIDFDAGW
jgi:hypothetical protein